LNFGETKTISQCMIVLNRNI